MYSKLSCYHLKIVCHKSKRLYERLTITKNQKPLVDTQKTETRIEAYHNKIINSQRKTARKEERSKRMTKKPGNN